MKISTSLMAIALLAAVPAATYAMPDPVPQSIDLRHPKASAKAVAGGIEIDNPGDEVLPAAVYSITGNPVQSVTVEPAGSMRLDLKAGIYIVRLGDEAVRILVR